MIVQCPDCNSILGFTENALQCSNCGFSYKRDEFGVIHQKETTFEYAHTHESTGNLAKDVKDLDSSLEDYDTVQELENKYDEFGYEYCVDVGRFDWLSIGELENKVVLDIGCGFGGASIYAAKRGAKAVYSIDGNLARLQFLGARAENEGYDNIFPIHADAMDLHLDRESVDVCLMVGSLEWMGVLSDAHESPKEAQEALLSQVNDIIVPGGDLFVAIENRYALQHFAGRTPHTGEPAFSTILPRFIADVISKVTGNGQYNILTHSYFEYHRMLNEAGFQHRTFYLPLPSYQFPTIVTKVGDGTLRKALSRLTLTFPRSLVKQILILLDKINLAHIVAPAYIIRGQK